MDVSESFEPSSRPQPYEFRADMEFLPKTHLGGKRAKLPEIKSSLQWQEHLLPISCIATEDNVAVLKQELETAHQLLRIQQTAIHTLTENLTNCDLQLQHTQHELITNQQICDRNSAQLTEAESICRDLKTQLRRQQQRVLQYRNLLNERTGSIPSLSANTQSFQETLVSFGYESITVETEQPRSICTQRPAVAAWSAPESIDLTGPLACYRKLATIRMTTAMIRVESGARGVSKTTAVNTVAQIPVGQTHALESNYLEPIEVGSKQTFQIELPSFTQSSSK
jgi:hypothetical protein